jgi:cell filamentation protein
LEGNIFWFTDGDKIEKEASKIFGKIKENNYFKNLNTFQFAKNASDVLIDINRLHPFREGNGRTQRLFMEQLAKEAGHNMNINKNVSKEQMIEACTAGMSGRKLEMLELFMNAMELPGMKLNNDKPNQETNLEYNSQIGKEFNKEIVSDILNGKTQTTSLISQRLAACKEQQNSVKKNVENKNKTKTRRLKR